MEINQQLKKFFEEFPLYKKLNLYEKSEIFSFSHLRLTYLYLNFFCKNCEYIQTYKVLERRDNPWYFSLADSNIYRVTFYCTGCEEDVKEFFIEFTSQKTGVGINVVLRKIGQLPPPSIDIDPYLEKILDSKNLTELFKKGLISESQSYGLGAYVYYRRVLEEIIDDILDYIKDILEGEEKEKYLKALEEIKNSKITEQKIEIAKEVIPSFLKPNGLNPLQIIYDNLSKGIHKESDEECLEKASAIRESLIFLIKETITKKEESKKYVENIKKLLDKKK